jgi:flagellar motor component MotA
MDLATIIGLVLAMVAIFGGQALEGGNVQSIAWSSSLSPLP